MDAMEKAFPCNDVATTDSNYLTNYLFNVVVPEHGIELYDIK